MAEDSDAETLSIQIANQLINIANNRMQEGIEPPAIAAAMRHAAANFTAFVEVNMNPGGTADPSPYIEEFVNMFGYYLERHQPQQPAGGAGLRDIIRRVEEEF